MGTACTSWSWICATMGKHWKWICFFFSPRLLSYWGLNTPADYLRAFKCKLGYGKPSLKTLSFALQIIDGLKHDFGCWSPNKLQARGFLHHEPCMDRFIHCACARTSCSSDKNKQQVSGGEICNCQHVHMLLPESAHAMYMSLLHLSYTVSIQVGFIYVFYKYIKDKFAEKKSCSVTSY